MTDKNDGICRPNTMMDGFYFEYKYITLYILQPQRLFTASQIAKIVQATYKLSFD